MKLGKSQSRARKWIAVGFLPLAVSMSLAGAGIANANSAEPKQANAAANEECRSIKWWTEPVTDSPWNEYIIHVHVGCPGFAGSNVKMQKSYGVDWGPAGVDQNGWVEFKVGQNGLEEGQYIYKW